MGLRRRRRRRYPVELSEAVEREVWLDILIVLVQVSQHERDGSGSAGTMRGLWLRGSREGEQRPGLGVCKACVQRREEISGSSKCCCKGVCTGEDVVHIHTQLERYVQKVWFSLWAAMNDATRPAPPD